MAKKQQEKDLSRNQETAPKDKPKVKRLRKTSVDDLLVNGEHVVLQAGIHPGIYWKTLVVFIVSILVGLFIFPLGVLLAATALAMFIYNTLLKEILLLVLTNKRVLVRYGILQVDVVDIRFSKIESIELERMIPGYLMGYANVVIMGTGNRYIVIPFVGNALEFRRAYNAMTLSEDGDLAEQED
ncbi:MAG: PH domain-containing protein [Alphaproteobacteria bacterium]|nr:PH domain-containing protein [Alphaproteobacteria bacterium]